MAEATVLKLVPRLESHQEALASPLASPEENWPPTRAGIKARFTTLESMTYDTNYDTALRLRCAL
jgi:hypothetical protein